MKIIKVKSWMAGAQMWVLGQSEKKYTARWTTETIRWSR